MRHTARPVPIPPYHSRPTVAGRWARPGLLPDWFLLGAGVGQVPYLPGQGSESLAYMARGRAVEWVTCLPGGKGAGPTYLPEGTTVVMVAGEQVALKLCLHITFACACTSTSNIVLSQWLMQRMGLNPFSVCAFVSS